MDDTVATARERKTRGGRDGQCLGAGLRHLTGECARGGESVDRRQKDYPDMQSKLAKPDFLTFSDLTARWGYSAEYVHDLIRTGRIVPAVALTDQERYVGGQFSGGYVVGDVDNARHQSYAEYYVGTVPGRDDHYENRPQCGRIVFCHSPEDVACGPYSFQFVSESAYPGHTAQWFYLDHAARISGVDGERRFRFVWSEIERFESENMVSGETAEDAKSVGGLPAKPISDPAPVQGTTRHSLKNRVHPLDAEIAMAISTAVDPDDVHSVWAELLKMTERRVGCLLEVIDGEIKYDAGKTIKLQTKDAFREKLRRMKTR